MAITYEQISSSILSTETNTVTFSSIPNTYTDLVLKVAARNNTALANSRIDMRFNGVTTTVYSRNYGITGGSAGNSVQTADLDKWENPETTAGTVTPASGFSNVDFYIPAYANPLGDLVTKPAWVNSAVERMITSDSGVAVVFGSTRWRQTAVINSITLTTNSGNWVVGSSFFLYGILRA